MNKSKTKINQIIKSKEWLLYVILIVPALGLIGWLSGNMILASYSLSYIPIAPSNIILISTLIIISLLNLRFENIRLLQRISVALILLIISFCLYIIIKYFFSLSSDIEKVLLRDPQSLGNVSIGRMSPISSALYILICLALLGVGKRNKGITGYIGGSLALLTFLISSVLLIGYLYEAPLLYGGKIIPISLPSAICFLLFSIVLLKTYDSKYWTYNLIRHNKVTRLLLKSFLPVVVLLSILQGFLDAVYTFNDDNPSLTGAIILLIVITATTIIIYRVSAIIGNQLLAAEEKLKESEEKTQSIMEHSADAIFITDHDGKYIYTNKAATFLLGYTSEEMKTKSIADISPPDKIEAYFEILRAILSDGKIFTEIELLKKDGTYISTDINAVLLPHGHVFATCRDITERKKYENALKESEKKLLKLNLDKNRFISILGHDLKNPFNNILGLSQTLTEDIHKLSPGQIEDFATDIYKTTKNTYTLLEEILLWARSQQGVIPFHPKEMLFKDLTIESFEILQPNATAKNISLNYLSADSITVFADRDMMKTILRNLISNAIKYTRGGGSVNVNAVEQEGQVILSVSDNGIGISPESLTKLFDISQVISTDGTAEETGTGLGLLLCKEFVERHNGKIWAESIPGNGSEFKFTLPCSSTPERQVGI